MTLGAGEGKNLLTQKNKHWNEYFQQNMYGRDSSFQSISGLDEKRITHEEYLRTKTMIYLAT